MNYYNILSDQTEVIVLYGHEWFLKTSGLLRKGIYCKHAK